MSGTEPFTKRKGKYLLMARVNQKHYKEYL